MKKLSILKGIIDFIWIIAVPITAPAVFLFSIIILFKGQTIIDFDVLGISINLESFLGRLLITLLSFSFLLMIYSLHLFRKTLRYFKQVKIFDDFVITTFNKIGLLLIISGTSSLFIGIFSKLYFESKVTIALGFHPYLLIVGLGLFFQILSEIFAVAKQAKQENDLTI